MKTLMNLLYFVSTVASAWTAKLENTSENSLTQDQI
jgi:hypothetical protein